MYYGNKRKIKSFTDLNAWKEAIKLVVLIYQATKKFPREELFCLTSQIRRAVISVASNIAEGFTRSSKKDKNQFYRMALSSLTETQNQLFIAKELKYLDQIEFNSLAQQTIVVSKLINGLLKSSSSHNT